MVVDASQSSLTHVGVAIVWGLVVMVMIFAVGRVSGAHMNPAVTIAFTAMGKMTVRDCGLYVASQFFGACLGALAIMAVMGNEVGSLGATTTILPAWSAVAVEFTMTAILMFVVIGVSTGAKEESVTAAIAVGATIAMEAFVAGPLTKASMNPARSLGPALFADSQSGALSELWIYIVAPIAGALFGALLCKILEPKHPGASEN